MLFKRPKKILPCGLTRRSVDAAGPRATWRLMGGRVVSPAGLQDGHVAPLTPSSGEQMYLKGISMQ